MENAGRLIDMEAWREMFIRAASELLSKVSGFLPQLLAALAILSIGWLVARAIEIATRRLLRTLGLDRAAARVRLSALLERAEIRMSASQIVAKAVFWIVMLTTILSAVETVGLTAVTATIDRLIAYIPNLIGAGLVAVLGMLGARVLGGIVRSAGVAAHLDGAARMGIAVEWAVASMAVIAAAEQLGIATSILIAPVTVVLGALTLSAGLAVGLGARPIITHVLAGHFLRRSLPNESLVVVQGEQGSVEHVGATETRLRGESKTWTVPNARLLDEVVTWV